MADVTKIISFFDRIKKHTYFCKNCGVCIGVCPTNCISFYYDNLGELIPYFDKDKCIACNLCIKVCPGKEIYDLGQESILGDYKSLYLIKSNIDHVRYHGSSGGAISQILKCGVQNSFLSEAIVLGKDIYDPINPMTFTINKSDDLDQHQGSKYISSPAIGLKTRDLSKNTAITCLPCQAFGIRQYTEYGYIIGLFC